MTLDEAIKHAEEVAEEKENEAQDLEYSKLDWRHEANQCFTCAVEHRQLAEWLKELKQLREQQSCENSIVEWKKDFKGYVNSLSMPRDDYNGIMEYIDELLVTPQPKTGHWTNGDPICPCCGEDKFKDLDADIWSDWQPKFCPNCGAKMVEPQERSDKE